MENINISQLTKQTAENLYELLIKLSLHIETLEAENAELRKKLQDQSE